MGMRLPHPDEWPMVPTQMPEGMHMVVLDCAKYAKEDAGGFGDMKVDWRCLTKKNVHFSLIIL
jgi:hypothetical protein